ncbi:MAG TPA: SRPBCC family protein [Lacunisphaera sp.]|nr:SRPBCC family protein [Lacunisphaera sp.]
MKLLAHLWLPAAPASVFPFFAEAENLQAITPGWLDFSIVGARPVPIRQGTVIDYRLRLHGVPLSWQSEITVWEPPHRFRDEQRRGPYRRWAHTHTFEACAGGTLCRDEVDYIVPGGDWIERWFVRHDLRRIFEHRQRALLAHFAPRGDATLPPPAGRTWSVTFAAAGPKGAV